ncbi:MAG: purine-nucleoside phosphorylase [Syntrophales bacterium]|nr:purine-nucleoside phosphorylase [Syntrophales bacterium]MDD5640737.1 purine-nucleoside phosphorylase [Syntrophales bacterium]
MSAPRYFDQVEECAAFLGRNWDTPPEWGIILGTGMGLLTGQMEEEGSLPYEELPHYPRATSPSHRGHLSWGRLAGARVLLFQGRLHAYEGYSLRQVTFPVRVMAALGLSKLVLTNAAGGLNPLFQAGELMLIRDHINFLGDSPLTGENVDAWGPRFPDLSRVYDRYLMQVAEETALKRGLVLRQGVYVAVKGPHLETPAETRFLRLIGADAVGMSTVPEAICAVHAGLQVLGVSVLSNLNLPDAMAPTSLEEIVATVARAEPQLVQLLLGILEQTAAARA